MTLEELLKLNKAELTRMVNELSPQGIKIFSEEATKRFQKLYQDIRAQIKQINFH